MVRIATVQDAAQLEILNNEFMNTIILTSYLDFYEKDEQGNKVAHNFGNDNGILDCLKANIKKYDNFVFVANGMEGEKADAYFKLACESFELTLPFKNYYFLSPKTKGKAKELIENADFIFLCGGHLPTQNKFFNEIGLKELLKNTNALIVGGSAGSMNCADVVYCPPELEEEVLDKNFNRYLKGLGLTNINIIPHFEEYKKMTICGKKYIDDIVVPDSKKIDIIGLNNGSYIVIKNGASTIYGESYLIRKEQIEDVTAFGDDAPDIGMLKLCGTGVAMGNAIDSVKEVADIVIGSNDEDGIAKYLEQRSKSLF